MIKKVIRNGILLGGLMLLVGCGQLQQLLQNASLTTNSTRYKLIFEAQSYADKKPITTGNLSWQLLNTDKVGQVNSSGIIEISDVPLGKYTLKIYGTGFVTENYTVNTGTTASADQLFSREIIPMYENNATLNITVYKSMTEGVATGTVVEVTWTISAGLTVDLPLIYTTDSDGKITIPNAPGGLTNISITSRPMDIDNDGVKEFSGTSTTTDLLSGKTTSVSLFLQKSNTSPTSIISTNIDSNRVRDTKIYFVFNKEMSTSTPNTGITFQKGYTNHPVSFQWVSSTRLEIIPVVNPASSSAYYIGLNLKDTTGKAFTQVFNNIDWAFSDQPAANPITQTVSNLRIRENTKYDYNATSFTLLWNNLAGASGFYIYAKNNDNVTDWMYITKVSASDSLDSFQQTVSLPSVFDKLANDNNQTPLWGTQVTFCVVPIEAVNPSPSANHATVTVKDTVAPNVTYFDENNTSADRNYYNSTVDIYFSLTFSEPVTDFPTISFTDTASPAGNIVLNAANGYWRWENTSRTEARFYITVPAGSNAKGDTGTIDFSNINDYSGNSFKLTSNWYYNIVSDTKLTFTVN